MRKMYIFALQALVWDNALTGPFGLIAEYSLLKVFRLFLLLTSHNCDIALKTILPYMSNCWESVRGFPLIGRGRC